MGVLMGGVVSDDELPIGEEGEWALEKHALLRRYIDSTSATRRKFTDPTRSNATRGCYIYRSILWLWSRPH